MATVPAEGGQGAHWGGRLLPGPVAELLPGWKGWRGLLLSPGLWPATWIWIPPEKVKPPCGHDNAPHLTKFSLHAGRGHQETPGGSSRGGRGQAPAQAGHAVQPGQVPEASHCVPTQSPTPGFQLSPLPVPLTNASSQTVLVPGFLPTAWPVPSGCQACRSAVRWPPGLLLGCSHHRHRWLTEASLASRPLGPQALRAAGLWWSGALWPQVGVGQAHTVGDLRPGLSRQRRVSSWQGRSPPPHTHTQGKPRRQCRSSRVHGRNLHKERGSLTGM